MSLHDEWPLINIIMPLGLRLSRAAQYAYVLAGWLVYCAARFFCFSFFSSLCPPVFFFFFSALIRLHILHLISCLYQRVQV